MDILDGSGLWLSTDGGGAPPPPPAAPPTLGGGGGRLVDESPLWEVPMKHELDDDEELLVLLH